MFWRRKVFHPVWMPLEPQQWNYRTWDGAAEPIQEFICTGIHCSSSERSSRSESVFYGSVIWQWSRVVPSSCLLSLFIPAPILCWHHLFVGFLFSWVSSLLCITAQPRTVGLAQGRQQSQQGWGGHGASSDFMLELMTPVFSTASLHPFVKAENRMEGREQEGCVEFGVGTVFSSPSGRCCMQR